MTDGSGGKAAGDPARPRRGASSGGARSAEAQGAAESAGAGSRWRRWAAPAFLAAAGVATLLFYREFVLDPARMIFGTDMVGEGFPLRRFLVEEVRAGRGVPLWNPFVYGGLPYVATLPGPVFYPTTLLYFVLPLYRAIGWTFVAHTFLAGAFGWFMARSFRLSRSSAAVSGTAFMFCGYIVSTLYGGHDGRIFAMVLIPLALGLLERALSALEDPDPGAARRGAAGWALALGLVVACQIFTPHTQMMYFSSLLLAAYWLFRVVAFRGRMGGWGPAAGRGAAAFGLAFGLAAVVGAVQLLPTFALLDDVARAATERGYEFAASWALPPQELTALFLPDLVGALQDGYWGANPFKLHTEYLGALPVALSVVALAASLPAASAGGFSRRERLTVWFLAAASVAGVLFALGAATPVHRIAYELVPMMDAFRAPSMMVGPVAALVALLAGFGWERIRRARGAAAGAGAGGVDAGAGAGRPGGAEAGGGGARGRGQAARSVAAETGRRDGWTPLPWLWIGLLSAPFALLGLAAALAPAGLQDFAYHAWFPTGWPRRPPPELVDALRVNGWLLVGSWAALLGVARGLETGRLGEWAVVPLLLLLAFDLWRVGDRYLDVVPAAAALEPAPAVEALAEGLEPGERVWPVEGTFRPNELMFHGVPTVTGSQKFLLSWYRRLVGGLQYENLARSPVLWPLFDLRYLTTRSALETPLLRPAGQAAGIRMYEVAADPPHAFFPERVEGVAGPEEAARRTLALENAGGLAIVEVGGEPPPAGAGTAEVERYVPDEVVLAVRAERGGLLFVSDAWAPGWTAEVDGAEVPLLRVNAAFRGVEVPEGEHRVRLSYDPASYRAGRLLSLAGLAAAGGFFVFLLYGRRRAPADAAGRPGPGPGGGS